jgi:hypothetical protein
MDPVTITIVAVAAGLLCFPWIASVVAKASRAAEPDLLNDLRVVSRIGRQMRDAGNDAAASAANALIEAALKTPMPDGPRAVS